MNLRGPHTIKSHQSQHNSLRQSRFFPKDYPLTSLPRETGSGSLIRRSPFTKSRIRKEEMENPINEWHRRWILSIRLSADPLFHSQHHKIGKRNGSERPADVPYDSGAIRAWVLPVLYAPHG